jgi:hypothetical protein
MKNLLEFVVKYNDMKKEKSGVYYIVMKVVLIIAVAVSLSSLGVDIMYSDFALFLAVLGIVWGIVVLCFCAFVIFDIASFSVQKLILRVRDNLKANEKITV